MTDEPKSKLTPFELAALVDAAGSVPEPKMVLEIKNTQEPKPRKSKMAEFLAMTMALGGGGLPGMRSRVPEKKSYPCRACGKYATTPTGECSNCGAYVCMGCHLMHLGNASRPCPGGGTPVPEHVSKHKQRAMRRKQKAFARDIESEAAKYSAKTILEAEDARILEELTTRGFVSRKTMISSGPVFESEVIDGKVVIRPLNAEAVEILDVLGSDPVREKGA